jgi:DNA-binding NarL/FixJ family response regulator
MTLTEKELAVLALMAEGLKPAQISERLRIKIKAYSHIREQILCKLGAANDVQVGVRYAQMCKAQAQERMAREKAQRGGVLQ